MFPFLSRARAQCRDGENPMLKPLYVQMRAYVRAICANCFAAASLAKRNREIITNLLAGPKDVLTEASSVAVSRRLPDLVQPKEMLWFHEDGAEAKDGILGGYLETSFSTLVEKAGREGGEGQVQVVSGQPGRSGLGQGGGLGWSWRRRGPRRGYPVRGERRGRRRRGWRRGGCGVGALLRGRSRGLCANWPPGV